MLGIPEVALRAKLEQKGLFKALAAEAGLTIPARPPFCAELGVSSTGEREMTRLVAGTLMFGLVLSNAVPLAYGQSTRLLAFDPKPDNENYSEGQCEVKGCKYTIYVKIENGTCYAFAPTVRMKSESSVKSIDIEFALQGFKGPDKPMPPDPLIPDTLAGVAFSARQGIVVLTDGTYANNLQCGNRTPFFGGEDGDLSGPYCKADSGGSKYTVRHRNPGKVGGVTSYDNYVPIVLYTPPGTRDPLLCTVADPKIISD
jgi:hypothetical protein